MSIAVSEIRPFWMPELNEVAGNQKFGLSEWISKGEYYYISSPIFQDQFTLDLSGKSFQQNMLFAFAFDCNRMASAAFETMYSIEKSTKLPNSVAWLIIKSYYAAYYAGHAIIRMLGISCSQLNQKSASKLCEISQLNQNNNVLNIPSSYYSCIYDGNTYELSFKNIKSKGGVHESFWKIFYERIQNLSKSILTKPIVVQRSQDVFKKLDELCKILCYRGFNGGNWLSSVRNQVNYRHELNAWFPHRKWSQQSVQDMFRDSSMWLDDPMNISLLIQPGKPIDLFIHACNFIVALCRVLILDMSNRCSKGKSYLKDGSLKLLNQCT
ncbi:MAG: hypothetical protein HC775_01580 [Hyellaceae cyanobacterium CSU_1_1]|nr:hypothetical protein [Hyellaceae cyanobacterium CSU_1_1]